MWLDRFRNACIYLSRTRALVQVSGRPAIEITLDPKLPLERMLHALEPALPHRAGLRIHLSASFSPAVEVAYPAGLWRLREQEVFARSVCAAHLGEGTDAVLVQIDPMRSGIAAPLARADWDALSSWCKQHGRLLTSVRPLWSLAMTAPAACAVSTLALIEPDSATLVTEPELGQGSLRGLSLPLDSPQQAASTLHRMHQALAVPLHGTCIMLFGRSRATGSGRSAPRDWRAYWAMA